MKVNTTIVIRDKLLHCIMTLVYTLFHVDSFFFFKFILFINPVYLILLKLTYYSSIFNRVLVSCLFINLVRIFLNRKSVQFRMFFFYIQHVENQHVYC